MYALLLTLSLALAAPETTYAITDGGLTLSLPKGFTMSTYSNLDAEAKSEDGPQLFKLWLTTWQIDVTETSAKAWSAGYVKMLEGEGLTDVKLDKVEVVTIGGRATAQARLTFTANKNPGVAYFMAMPVAGQVVHARMISSAKKEQAALASMTSIFETMKLDKPAYPAVREVSTAAGFAATLPEGWRVPYTEEMSDVVALTTMLGKDEINPDNCWVGVRPPASGKADVLMACTGGYYLGPVDEHSFAGEEVLLREHFFARVSTPIAPAEPITVGDRMGFYYKPGTGKTPIRMAVAPYGAARVMVAWGLGAQMDDATLDQVMNTTLATVKFTGPDGGAPQIGIDKRIGYWLSYRTTHPVVLGPILLVVVGFAAMIRKMRKMQEMR